jgi:hypothetical protein
VHSGHAVRRIAEVKHIMSLLSNTFLAACACACACAACFLD